MKKILYKNKRIGWAYFSVLSIFVFVILLVMFLVQSNSVNLEYQTNISNDLKTYTIDIDNKVAAIASDVLLLEHLILNKDIFLVDGDEASFTSSIEEDKLAEDLVDWLSVKVAYDQIRIIDPSGQEVLRVNSNQGDPEVVAHELLQNKASRYYFENSIDLDDDYLYLSKIDLNVENGEIELINGSPKEMLRIATTLFDDENNKIGVLIVNYLVSNLFHDSDVTDANTTTFEIINEQGYYLHSANTDIEYGFMFDDKRDETFSKYHQYPIFDESTSLISQEVFEQELYTSLVITNTKLSESISSAVGREITVYSDNGDILIFGEIEVYKTPEFINLVRVYTVLLFVLVIIAGIISRLIDEVVFTRKEQVKFLEYSNSHDSLTGLPNRLAIFEKIEYLNSRGQYYTLLFLDLDGFKLVNDNFGHNIGDKVLIDSAERFKHQVRKYDIVARLGGDEFLILLSDLVSVEVIARVTEKIRRALEEPFIYNNVKCMIGVSIGVAIQKGEYTTEEIMNQADNKMYIDKELRKKKRND